MSKKLRCTTTYIKHAGTVDFNLLFWSAGTFYIQTLAVMLLGQMRIKIIGILTLVLYLGIKVRGEHVGGPLIIFVLFGLFDDSVLVVMGRFLILLAVCILLWTIFRPSIKRDKFIVPTGLIILFVPLIEHLYERPHYYWTNVTPFTITSGLFVILASYWIVTTLRLRT